MERIKTTIHSFLSYTKTEKWKHILSIIVTCTFLFYFFCSIMVYAIWIPGATFFAYGRASGQFIRIFISFLIACVGILVYITYRKKINNFWIFLFSLLILFNLLSIFITPSHFYILYRGTTLYPFLTSSEIQISTYDIVIGFLSFAVDIMFGFLIFYVFPHSFKKTTFILLITFFLLFMMYSFIYSFIKERSYYKYFFSGNWKYNADGIGSIFGNKQQWGIFLSITTLCSLLLCFLVRKSNYKLIIKISLYVFSLISCPLAILCSVVSFCKTAIICSIVSLGLVAIFLVLALFKNKKTRLLGILFFILFGILIALIILFCVIPSLQTTKLGSLLKNIFDTLLSRGEIGVNSRLEIVVGVLQNFPSVNLFIGIPKGMVTYYVMGLLPELPNGLHSGIVIYFSRVGMFGMILYFILNIILVINILKILKKNIELGGILLSCYLVSIILDLSELEILIMSSSGSVLMLNLICVILTNSLSKTEINSSEEARI